MSTSSKPVVPLTPLQLPEPRIERVRNALVVPVQKGGRLPNGVFRSNGTFCEHSRTLLSQSRFTDIPDRPDRRGVMRISGRHVFGGVMRDHFGHFLLESLGRLWVFDHLTIPWMAFFSLHAEAVSDWLGSTPTTRRFLMRWPVKPRPSCSMRRLW